MICCPTIYRAMIGYSNIRRAFRWHKNIYRGIRFIPVLSIAFHRVEIKRTLKALHMRHTQVTSLEISSSIRFQMLRSPSILILLLALASAVKPQELSIEDIVKGTMQVIKIYRQQMAKTMYLSYCGVECLLLFYIPPVSRRFPGFFYTCEPRRKEPAKWKHMFQVTFCIIILQLGMNHLLNSPRAFAFVNNQQNCFLPDCCCFLPFHWGPLGLSITSQINRVNMTAKQSPPIFKRS